MLIMLSMEYQTTIIKALTPASIWDWGWELLQLVIKILALELVGISGSHWEKKRDFKIRKIYMKENLPYMSIRSGREIPNMNNNLLNNIIAIKGIISENTIAMIFSNEPNSGRQNGFDMHRSLKIRRPELVAWSEATMENNRNVDITTNYDASVLGSNTPIHKMLSSLMLHSTNSRKSIRTLFKMIQILISFKLSMKKEPNIMFHSRCNPKAADSFPAIPMIKTFWRLFKLRIDFGRNVIAFGIGKPAPRILTLITILTKTKSLSIQMITKDIMQLMKILVNINS